MADHHSKGKPANRGAVMSNAEFARLWADVTVSVEEIGARLGISGSAVCVRAKTRGLGRRPRMVRKKPTISDHALFRELYLSRVRTKDLCAFFGVSHPIITKTADRLGIPRRNLPKGRGAMPIAEFMQIRIRARMAAAARIEQAAMINAELTDKRRDNRFVGADHARSAA